jgi:hypothetical protein
VIHSLLRASGTFHRGLACVPIVGLILALGAPAHASPAFGPKDYVVKPSLPLPAIERFPACQPAKGGQLRVENGPNGRARVALAVIVLNQGDALVMAEGPGQRRLVERAVSLAASNTLLVWMIGPPGATLSVSVTSTGACLDVAITSPLPGASVPEGPLLVRGTVSGPVETGVSVNGFSAMVQGGQWAVEFPVDPSVQVLTATASVVGGLSKAASSSITVSSATPPAIELVADPTDGIAPLAVSWKVVNHTGRALIQYELDPTGGGSFDPPVSGLDGTETTYPIAGLWFPSIRVTDDQGVTYTSTTVLAAGDPATVTARFDALWTGFKSRLQAGDVSGALSFVAPSLRPSMERIFQDLGADLPAIASSIGAVHVTDQVGELAEGILVQNGPSGPRLYFIQFRRDGLGRWLVEEM